jgi:hypothetical protein
METGMVRRVLTEKEARDFELYLKTGSGKAFAYKRFVSVALAKDFLNGRIGVPRHGNPKFSEG